MTVLSSPRVRLCVESPERIAPVSGLSTQTEMDTLKPLSYLASSTHRIPAAISSYGMHGSTTSGAESAMRSSRLGSADAHSPVSGCRRRAMMGLAKSTKLDCITEITVPVSGRVSYDHSKLTCSPKLTHIRQTKSKNGGICVEMKAYSDSMVNVDSKSGYIRHKSSYTWPTGCVYTQVGMN
ncbi:hypothetical protein F4604DRAFT_1261974 [Suillus subluteus]|nr:hypothetical protein F4604DRAFT_1261974 [Suillus subluteus]